MLQYIKLVCETHSSRLLAQTATLKCTAHLGLYIIESIYIRLRIAVSRRTWHTHERLEKAHCSRKNLFAIMAREISAKNLCRRRNMISRRTRCRVCASRWVNNLVHPACDTSREWMTCGQHVQFTCNQHHRHSRDLGCGESI